MTPPSPEPVNEVDAVTLRELFTAARIEDRAAAGELAIKVKRGTERPAPPHIGEPPGTISHTIVYVDHDDRGQAIAHEYPAARRYDRRKRPPRSEMAKVSRRDLDLDAP